MQNDTPTPSSKGTTSGPELASPAASKQEINSGRSSGRNSIKVPELQSVPVLYPHGTKMVWITADGVIQTLNKQAIAAELALGPVLVCHRRWSEARCGCEINPCLDVMELFAFARPARFCLPTPAGLASQMSLPRPQSGEDMAAILPRAAFMLLDELAMLEGRPREEAANIAQMMAAGGWMWGPLIMLHMGLTPPKPAPPDGLQAAIWRRLPEYTDYTPTVQPGSQPIIPDAARERLAHMLQGTAEARPSQADYAAAVTASFDTPDAGPQPALVLAEAGTGTGKTLGYLAPATLWAEKNGAAVWISTYTRTLQHQIASELSRLYPDATTRAQKVVLRKGRENYLCLLNLEEALMQMPGQPRRATALGLMARWAGASDDGDLTGASFPAWLMDLVGRAQTTGLADRRGECIHAACQHYNKCFVEKSTRRAKRADIVVTNHALVMINAAYAGDDDKRRPMRYVFDEGHHVFDAADSAFAAYMSAQEAAELRHWVRGAEDGRRGRARGLKKRLGELLANDDAGLGDLEASLEAARQLPGQGWPKRLSGMQPVGPAETFFMHLRNAIYSRAADTHSTYDIEAHLHPASDELIAAGKNFKEALIALGAPLSSLVKRLKALLDDKADELESSQRARIEGAIRGLELRASGPVAAWQLMLADIAGGPRDGFVDWMQIDRTDGQDRDVGVARHWLDPTIPFASTVLEPSHGVTITSATLQDQAAKRKTDASGASPPIADGGPPHDGWQSALALTGAAHLAHPTMRASFTSPFDYPNQTRILVVNDLERDRPEATAAAMAGLMQAAGGGGLGLFTAIRRLKAVYPALQARLEEAGLPLFAQHIDQMNLQTLLAMFREEPESCLLGTDAVRDGIDVPGAALRLIVFDRMPWPRSDILFQARAEWQGRDKWTERITRLKLRQAFGRLIRRADDKGVFVMLDSRLPTRLTSAFPDGVEVQRIGLAEAILQTRIFLEN
ncbi:ATP-dependent DNA helicase [Alphaproteobacteria bacterium]|nr:ATP-dependent DNA helicase [Alphaproteobacteria bacterium]